MEISAPLFPTLLGPSAGPISDRPPDLRFSGGFLAARGRNGKPGLIPGRPNWPRERTGICRPLTRPQSLQLPSAGAALAALASRTDWLPGTLRVETAHSLATEP